MTTNSHCIPGKHLTYYSTTVRLHLLAVISVLGLLPLFGADSPQDGSIVFREVAPAQAKPPGSPGLHWVITEPESAAVSIVDPAVAALIKDWLTKNGKLHDWLLNPRTPWSLPEVLSQAIGRQFELTRVSQAFRTPPKPTDVAAKNVVFPIRFRALSRPTVSGLDIRITTQAGAAPQAKTARVELGQVAPHVAAFGVVAESELASEQDRNVVNAALAQVARQAWAVSQSRGIVVGSKVDDPAFLDRKLKAEEELANLYRLSGAPLDALGWPAPSRPSYTPKAPVEAGAWNLNITGVEIVRDATIEVPLVQIKPGRNESADSIARRQGRADDLKRQTEKKAQDHLRLALDSLRNTVPTNPTMRATLGAVEAESVLLPPATVKKKDQTVIFVASDRRRRFGYDTTVEGGWSSEDRLVGKGTFNGDNLFGLSDIGKHRVDSQTLSFSAGTDVQQANGSWQLLTTRTLDQMAVLKWTLGFNGEFREDRNQLFANAKDTRLSFDSRRIGPVFTLEYSSPLRTRDEKPKVFVAGWKSVVGPYLGFGSVVRQEGFPEGKGEITSGKFASFKADEQLQLRWRLRPVERGGIGELQARFTATGEASPDWLQYHFRRGEATAELEATFGFSQSRDFLARYRTGMAAASQTAPIFELPQLGGPEGVRGIELGEQIGRKIGYSQFAAGPSIESIATWIRKKRPVGAALGPIKLADAYVTGFLDRGAAYGAGHKSGLDRLLWPTANLGYGGAVELRNLALGSKRGRLSIGYAFSPDSTHHPHGFPVTSLAVDLF